MRTRHRRLARLLLCSAASQSLLSRGLRSAIVRRGVPQGCSRQRSVRAWPAPRLRSACAGGLSATACACGGGMGASAPGAALARASLCSVMRLAAAAVPGQGSRCRVMARPAAREQGAWSCRIVAMRQQTDSPPRELGVESECAPSCGLVLVFVLKALARAARSMPICDRLGAQLSLSPPHTITDTPHSSPVNGAPQPDLVCHRR
jgi:hypothetical protein